MSANLQPITSDGGFITGGNIDVSNYPVASPAPYINGFSTIEALDQLKIGDARFNSNGTITNGTLRVDANTSARLSVIDPNTVFNTYFQAVENYANIYVANGSGDATWQFTSDGNLTLPGNTFSVNYANGTQVSIGGGGGTPNALSNGSALFTLMSDNTLLSGNSTSPQNFKVNDTYTPDIDLRNASGTGMFTQGANITLRTAGTYNWNFDNAGNLSLPGNMVFNSNVYINNGFTLSTLPDIGGQVDYNNHTVGYVADNNGSASLYARDSAGLGNNNAVITANATNGKVTLLAANTTTNQTWTFDGDGNLTLPGNTFSVNYANGTQVSIGGGGSYGDSNVVTLLGSFGSNTITTTGNVSVGNIIATNIGNISSTNKDGNASNVLLGNGAFVGQGTLKTLVVADTFANTSSGSSLAITSSMYRILINAGTSSSYTFTLPDTNTCYVGQSFVLASAQTVTQNYSYTIALFGGGSSGQAWTAGTNIVATCVAQRGGSAETSTNWKYSYQGGVGVTGTGAQVMSISPSISGLSVTGAFDTSGSYMMTSLVGEKFQTWSYTVGGVTAVPTAVATGGVFTIPSTAGMSTGQAVTITGTNGGTGSISGYTSGTTYYIIATPAPGGATSVTLSASRNSGTAITTTAGTLSGLTMTFGPQVGFNPYGQFGHIINLTGTVNANFDISYVGVNQTNPAYNVTLIINQGATAYVPQNFYVGSYGGYVGTAATINWAGGVTPTGTPNKKDVISLSWLQGTQFTPTIVLGQLVSYG